MATVAEPILRVTLGSGVLSDIVKCSTPSTASSSRIEMLTHCTVSSIRRLVEENISWTDVSSKSLTAASKLV